MHHPCNKNPALLDIILSRKVLNKGRLIHEFEWKEINNIVVKNFITHSNRLL